MNIFLRFWPLVLAIAACPKVGNTTQEINLQSSVTSSFGFWEVSGIALSSVQTGPSGEPILYAVNDRGGGSTNIHLGIFDSGTGIRLVSLRLTLMDHDVESLTIGSCSHDQAQWCLYIGDIGDNQARRSRGGQSSRNGIYRIVQIPEPIWMEYQDDDELSIEHMMILTYEYPDGPADAETLFTDQTNLYVVTKWNRDDRSKTRLFRIPSAAWEEEPNGGVYSPQAIDIESLHSKTWTRGEVSSSTTFLLLGDVRTVYLFEIQCQDRIEDALQRGPCVSWRTPSTPDAKQHEALAIHPRDEKVLQLSECTTANKQCLPPMVWTNVTMTPHRVCSPQPTNSPRNTMSPTTTSPKAIPRRPPKRTKPPHYRQRSPSLPPNIFSRPPYHVIDIFD